MAQNKTEEEKPSNPSDFGDLGPVEEAPDVVRKSKPVESEKQHSPPKAKKKSKKVVLRPQDVITAIKGGDYSGLPMKKGRSPELRDGEIVLISEGSKLTAAISGHALDCQIVSEIRLVKWRIRGSADELSGKWRLTNTVKMALGEAVVELKKGKEFFDHQISVESIRQAGGIVIPIGTQK